MNAKDAIKITIDAGSMVADAYLEDLTDEEMLIRPCPGCNHINWQLGHLVVSEHDHLELAAPGQAVPLPPGMRERYTNETATNDDPSAFCTKAELLGTYRAQRAATLAALEKSSDGDLERATGVEWAPTVASLYSMQGSHPLMHAGQWVIVRRMLGRKPLF
jgi:hypothetical protein